MYQRKIMMKIKLLTGLLAAALTPSVSLAINSAETSVTPKDPAIVNQERLKKSVKMPSRPILVT